MKLYTFKKGGIHPPENKITNNQPIKVAGLPNQVVLLLSQHIGAPAQPIVKKGDMVKAGTLIATANGMISAPVYSSVSGKVNRIDMQTDASGYKRQAIFIDVEGDEWEESIDRTPTLIRECDLSPEEILGKIEKAGIVGMGGAAFPTHIKLKPPKGFKAESLLINGAECEPYLTNDHRLMLEKGEELLSGAHILMKALGVKQSYIGIENNKRDAIEYLTKLTQNDSGIKVIPLKCKYPQGSEKHLIEAILHKRVKSGALPISVGAVVQNVSTVIAVYEAVQKNKPLFERVVTVTGKGLKEPANYLVRIGTPYQFLINLSGGTSEDTGKIISGGPMMGKAVADTSIPVTKGSSGILLLSEKEAKRNEVVECIRCAKCVEVCPMGLNPTQLMTLSEFNQWDKAEKEMITDCIECGSCSYTCPASRPLLDYIRLGKGTVLTNIRNRKS
ncbi:MAG: electron transport complex subunit RsxC [Bacteroidales bacterium]|nr:electron transport complex subunit RsxC [Bacteroidales bacterium]